jgi:flavin reductase ActVB
MTSAEPTIAADGLSQAFREAFRRVAATVVVVTYYSPDGGPSGMTATSVCSLSMEPPSVVVCVNRTARTYGQIAAGRRFGISLLSRSQRTIADHCSRPSSDKQLRREWLDQEAPGCGSPVLRESVAHLDCRLEAEHPGSTHAILVGHVEHALIGRIAEPLVYCDHGYRALADDESAALASLWDRVMVGTHA